MGKFCAFCTSVLPCILLGGYILCQLTNQDQKTYICLLIPISGAWLILEKLWRFYEQWQIHCQQSREAHSITVEESDSGGYQVVD